VCGKELVESRVLIPGRWYRAHYRESKHNWTVWSQEGEFLGEKPDPDVVKVSPTTPLDAAE
jgi:hypothetical protein